MHGQSQLESFASNMDPQREFRKVLNAGCFVIDQSDLDLRGQGPMRWAQVIGTDDQARSLSLFYIEASSGESPALYLGESEAVLFLQKGRCTISICGRDFDVQAGTGVHVRAGEHFIFANRARETSQWLISICPAVKGLDFDGRKLAEFNDKFPQRLVSGNENRMESTGDRFYKLLVGPSVGSEAVTQFIGRIPLSKAAEHFHLYEEAICILSGHGRLWNGEKHTEIGPGSLIFLPRKQPHCLECLDESGMELMGVFYPAGSPAINYET